MRHDILVVGIGTRLRSHTSQGRSRVSSGKGDPALSLVVNAILLVPKVEGILGTRTPGRRRTVSRPGR